MIEGYSQREKERRTKRRSRETIILFGGNGLRPSLRSQLVDLRLQDEIHIHENRLNDAACG